MLTATEPAGELAGLIAVPVLFCRGLLRHDLWPLQAAILRAVATDRRIAVKACHSSGKTFVAAAAVLWFVTRFPDGIVVTTAPTWVQVEKLLWAEIHKAVQRSRIQYPPLNKTELQISPGNYAIGLSTDQGTRFQGFHGRVLIVVDEAPGVKADIWEAIEGIRAGGDVRVLALGNPTIASGPFYDAFTTNRDGWTTFTISAFDTPNLQGLDLAQLVQLPDAELDRATRPYLVTRRWVREKFREWGPGHPLWEARVLGQFPTQAEDALISLSWLEAASHRPATDTGGRVTAGLDVAGPGEDETVLIIAENSHILAQHTWAKADPRGEVVAALAPYRARLDMVNVDTVGLGFHFATHLRDLGFPVRFVNVGETSHDAERYRNRKAEYYWGLRMRFEAGEVAGLTDERLLGQLAGIRYQHNARGQIEIETKEAALKRGVKSPDRAEALMLALARPRQSQILFGDAPTGPAVPVVNPLDAQLRDGLSFLGVTERRGTCGRCGNLGRTRDQRRTLCTLRNLLVQPSDIACDFYISSAPA